MIPQVTWNPFQLLRTRSVLGTAGQPPQFFVEILIPGASQPMWVGAGALDVECLELFPRGTMMLMQVYHGRLLDWTLHPKTYYGYKEPPISGEEWKDA